MGHAEQMRIAAIGDAHLGRSSGTAVTSEGVNQREADFEQSFLRSIDRGLSEQPDAFIWLGDVFDHPRPNYRSFRVVMQALQRIRAHGIPLLAISGNHDTPRLPGVGNPYAVLADAFPEFHFAYQLAYEAVDIAGLRTHLVPQTRTAEDAVTALRAAADNRSNDRVNLLLTHPLVHSVERRYADMNEIEIDDSELRSDLVLLGHYHVHCKVKPAVWYAGSTDTFSFADDPDEGKGLVLLDTDAGTCRHIALDGQRRLLTPDMVYCAGLGPAEVERAIMERLQPLPEGSVVRLTLDMIDVDVYRLLDLPALHDATRHLLHLKYELRFSQAVRVLEELPELATINARWRNYVDEQGASEFDVTKLAQTGQDYLQAAIESSVDPSTD